jgi:two-component system NarL family sensor kinase
VHKLEKYDILLWTVSGTLLFLLLAGFVLALLLIYRKRKLSHIREKQLMKHEFERQLLSAQLEIQEKSFRDISQEIHDNVGQVLSLTKVQLNIIEQDDLLNRPILNEAKDNLSKAILDLRDIAKSLNSERIAHFKLSDSVLNELDSYERTGVLSAGFKVDGWERDLNPNTKLIVFRIIQECVQNIIKHAETREISIHFLYGDAELQIDLQDKGKGFHVTDSLQESRGLGLRNMINRVEVIGGRINIISTLGEGTLISIFIPYA